MDTWNGCCSQANKMKQFLIYFFKWQYQRSERKIRFELFYQRVLSFSDLVEMLLLGSVIFIKIHLQETSTSCGVEQSSWSPRKWRYFYVSAAQQTCRGTDFAFLSCHSILAQREDSSPVPRTSFPLHHSKNFTELQKRTLGKVSKDHSLKAGIIASLWSTFNDTMR